VEARRIALTILDMSPVVPMPGMRLSAHFDLFKNDEETGEKILVSTSRLCTPCGKPLTGAVVPVDGDRQVHVECARKV
jgi:hypothetical protein